MVLLKELLPICPVCDLSICEESPYCRRCGCNLLLLATVIERAQQLLNEGKPEESAALYSANDSTQTTHNHLLMKKNYF